ncbi:MAG: dihydropteroate synthase [Paracoccaceae bacterium]
MSHYYRPIVRNDIARPKTAMPVAGGPGWVSEIEVLSRTAPPFVVPISDAPDACVAAITSARSPIAGLDLDQPRLMGILNVTPDSFSNDGIFSAPDVAAQNALALVQSGADIIDVGGESTRPGAESVSEHEETHRTAPAIAALRAQTNVPISIDTRKSTVAQEALKAGAGLVNDVSGFTYDAALSSLCVEQRVPVCVMHAQGDPATMQADPCYDDVLLDVYDFLSRQINRLVTAGIPRSQIMADPGIGFGKTLAHNLALLRRISLFHTLGCPILLGASRKRFIGTIGKGTLASDRAPGSIAVGLAALAQGVQILRVHDVEMTKQAIRLHNALIGGEHG